MVAPVKTQGNRMGDLIKFLDEAIYCIESYFLVNPAGEDFTFPVGTPCSVSGSNATPLAAAAQASVTALLLEATFIPSGETTPLKYSFVVRGPAVVDKDRLPTADYDAASYNHTTIATALAALDPPILSRTEPTIQGRQTS